MFFDKICETAKKHQFCFCFVSSFVLLSLGLVFTEISKLDVRFAVMINDMAAHGVTGIFPTINGVEYADYPVTWFFPAYITTCFGRHVTYFLMALPSMLTGAYIVSMVLIIGEKLKKGTGFFAALMILATFEIVYAFDGFGMDVPVAAASITALYVFLFRKETWLHLFAFTVLFLFSCAVRGSLGIVVFGSFCAGYFFAERKWKEFFLISAFGVVLCAVCVASVYFLTIRLGGRGLWDVFLEWQVGKRVAGGAYHFYFVDGFAAYAPITVFALLTAFFYRKKLLSHPLAGLLGSAFATIIILSIPGGKHLRYALASSLPLSLFASWGIPLLGRIVGERRNGIAYKIAVFLGKFLPFAGAAAALAVFVVFLVITGGASFPSIFNFGIGAVLFCILGVTVIRNGNGRLSFVFASLMLSAFFVNVFIIIPSIGVAERAKAFVVKVESIRKNNVCFYDLDPDHDPLRYVLHVPPEKADSITYFFPAEPRHDKHYSNMYKMKHFNSSAAAEFSEGDLFIMRKKQTGDFYSRSKKLGLTMDLVFEKEHMGHKSDYFVYRLVKKDKTE